MINNKYIFFCFIIICFALQLSSCEVQDGPPKGYVDVSQIPNAVPKVEPKSRYGNPVSYVVNGTRYYTMKSAKGYRATGIASWYGTKFHNRYTSSREPFSLYKMTAAHTSLPLPTYVRVTNLKNGRQIVVKVNDRGPFAHNRLIDLSYVAAKKLGIVAKGTGLVEVVAIDPGSANQVSGYNATVVHHPKTNIYLQMGAYSNKDNAFSMVENIGGVTSCPCKIYTTNKNGQPIYRVQIGPIKQVADADKVVAQLKAAGLPKPVTVIK
jgi:rare lipoprotein A